MGTEVVRFFLVVAVVGVSTLGIVTIFFAFVYRKQIALAEKRRSQLARAARISQQRVNTKAPDHEEHMAGVL